MIRISTLAHASTIIAAVSLSGAYAFSKQPLFAFVIIAMGISWIYARRKKWHWVSHAGFAVFLCGASVGPLMDVQPFVLLLSVASTLAAWDLDHLHQRLTQSKNVPKQSRLIRDHLYRLLAVEAIGIGLSSLALSLTLQIRFGVILLLGLILIIGLSRAVGMLREVIYGQALTLDWGEFMEADPLPLRHSVFQSRVKNYLQKFKQETRDH